MARPNRAPWLLWTSGILAVVLAAAIGLRTASVPLPPLPQVPLLDRTPEQLRSRLEEAHAAATLEPLASDAVADFGRLLHANGFSTQAAACWERLMVLEPEVGDWSYYLADLRRLAGDYAGMQTLLERTLEHDPTSAAAWLQLAEHRFKTGDLAGAQLAYERRLRLLPQDPYARLGVARIAFQQDRTDEALRETSALAADAPSFAAASNLHAELLTARGDHAAAAAARRTAADAGRFRPAPDPLIDRLLDDCFDYERLCARAFAEIAHGQPEQAELHLERARTLHPEAPTAHELLGQLYLARGDADRAVACYEQARQKASPSSLSAHFYVSLARAHRLDGRPADAIEALRAGVAALGESAELLRALGLALGDLPDPSAALAAHRRAVALDPADADAGYDHARALIANDQLDQAVKELHRIHTRHPAHPATLALLGQIEMDSGRWRSAARFLETLFEAQPDLPEAKAKMAMVRLRAGEEAEKAKAYEEAEKHYRAGVHLQPDDPLLTVRLALVLLQSNRALEAVRLLEAGSPQNSVDPQRLMVLARAQLAAGRAADARQALLKALKFAEQTGDSRLEIRLRELLQRLPR